MDGMNIFTVLDDAVRGSRGLAASSRIGEAGGRRQLVGLRDSGGECRRLFGVGGGPTEAVAEAKQERVLGLNHGSGGPLFLRWELLILDRSCQCSQLVDVPKTCANAATLALSSSSVRPTPAL